MEKMKTRFIIAVTQRLAAAPDSTAKVELIEELSDNLYSRWQDLVDGGAGEEDAYAQALEDLGDVDELLAYLESLGPGGELPKDDDCFKDFTSELLHGMEGIFRETVSQTKDAVEQAAVIVRDIAEKIKEKYPDGFNSRACVHMDDDDPNIVESTLAGEEAGGQRVTDTALPAQDLKSVDIQLTNGDVAISLSEDPDACVLLNGDVDKLEVRVSDKGVLSIRQGKTASASFLFLRGLASADVELTLPKRFWDRIQIATVNGDIEIENGLEARRLFLKTSSGDVSFQDASCTEVIFRSASGDLECGGTIGAFRAETSSGNITLAGDVGTARTVTASGDIEIDGSVREMSSSSASGDVSLRSQVVPQKLEVSANSGDCEVSIPGGEGFSLHFSTVSGALETNFELVGPVHARSGEAIYLDGGSCALRMTSVSGDLSLYQL